MNTIDKIRRFFYTPKIFIDTIEIDGVLYVKFCDGQVVESNNVKLVLDTHHKLLEEKRKERFGE